MKRSIAFAVTGALCSLATFAQAGSPLPQAKGLIDPVYAQGQAWLWDSVQKAKKEVNPTKPGATVDVTNGRPAPKLAPSYPTRPRTLESAVRLAPSYPTKPRTLESGVRLAPSYPTHPPRALAQSVSLA